MRRRGVYEKREKTKLGLEAFKEKITGYLQRGSSVERFPHMLWFPLSILIHDGEYDGTRKGPLDDGIEFTLHQMNEHGDVCVSSTVNTVQIDTKTQFVTYNEIIASLRSTT